MPAALAESRAGHGSSGTSRVRRGQPHCDRLSSSTHERPRQEAQAPRESKAGVARPCLQKRLLRGAPLCGGRPAEGRRQAGGCGGRRGFACCVRRSLDPAPTPGCAPVTPRARKPRVRQVDRDDCWGMQRRAGHQHRGRAPGGPQGAPLKGPALPEAHAALRDSLASCCPRSRGEGPGARQDGGGCTELEFQLEPVLVGRQDGTTWTLLNPVQPTPPSS